MTSEFGESVDKVFFIKQTIENNAKQVPINITINPQTSFAKYIVNIIMDANTNNKKPEAKAFVESFVESIKDIPEVKKLVIIELIKMINSIAEQEKSGYFGTWVKPEVEFLFKVVSILRIDDIKYLDMVNEKTYTLYLGFLTDDLRARLYDLSKEHSIKILDWLIANETKIENYNTAFAKLAKEDKELCLEVLNRDAYAIEQIIKPEWQTEEFLLDFISRCENIEEKNIYQAMYNPSEKVELAFVKKFPKVLEFIPKEKQTVDLVYEALKANPEVANFAKIEL